MYLINCKYKYVQLTKRKSTSLTEKSHIFRELDIYFNSEFNECEFCQNNLNYIMEQICNMQTVAFEL